MGSEKSTAQSSRLNGSVDAECTRGGTVSTGHGAVLSTFSVTEASTRCSNPLAP
jgi:hypothetical protein